jgi:hypothetical protein
MSIDSGRKIEPVAAAKSAAEEWNEDLDAAGLLRKPRKMPAQRLGNSKQDYSTPRAFLDAVERRWGELTFDLAGTHANAVVREFNRRVPKCYTPEQDSFKQPWGPKKVGLRPWLNPPFGHIEPWAARCAAKALDFRSPQPAPDAPYKIFFLVPASVGSNWFARYVDLPVKEGLARCCFLQGRLSFDGKNPYPKDCMLVVYNDTPGYEIWDWAHLPSGPDTTRGRKRKKKKS